ncbi:hypothetical protein JKP88DRAFT_289867 [Tribonema minus]|uniref:Uncharacterized protein n=1 Tax=Tribonema minus TaxID=303371 RepID=A0A836CGM6_9STRA|nr:hypothetical protein JKP88DRAFT_289867 [Tribonema minus]
MAFVTPMGEDVLSEDVCRGFIVKYMCESVMKIPEEAIYKKRSTREGGASAWKPPPRDVYLWTNPLWFGKGSRCRGPHVTGAGPVNGSRYCSCALIEVMVNDETSPSGRVIIAHRFAGNSPLGDAISQMFQSEVWQPYKHLKVYFKGCSTEVLNLPDVWSQRVICWGFAALQMIGATSDEMTTREWPAFRGELSNAGGDGKTFSISGVMGDHMSDVNRFDYTQAAEKLQEVTTDYGEKIFDVTQQVTLRFGHCASQIGPYTTEVDESIPLADTMLWDLRMRCLYLHRWLPPFKIELGDDFELVHDFRELRNALRWHYARVLTNLYGHENAPPDLSGTWPLLRPEHIVTTKREPGLHCGYYLRKRTSEIYRHAFSWEHKRQLSMGDSMQRCNDGSVMPHLYVPGMLSELATVHSFIPVSKWQEHLRNVAWRTAQHVAISLNAL